MLLRIAKSKNPITTHGKNFNIVDKLKSDHFSGFRNNENKLWSLIQFNQWYLNNIS